MRGEGKSVMVVLWCGEVCVRRRHSRVLPPRPLIPDLILRQLLELQRLGRGAAPPCAVGIEGAGDRALGRQPELFVDALDRFDGGAQE